MKRLKVFAACLFVILRLAGAVEVVCHRSCMDEKAGGQSANACCFSSSYHLLLQDSKVGLQIN